MPPKKILNRDDDIGVEKKRRANVKKMSDGAIHEEIESIESIIPTVSGTERTSLRTRLANLREELQGRRRPATTVEEVEDGERNDNKKRPRSPEIIEIDDDSDDDVLPSAGAGAGAGGEVDFTLLSVNLERGPSEGLLEYLARLVRAQDSFEQQLNGMDVEIDRLRSAITREEHAYRQDLERAQRELASAVGFAEQRRAQDVEFDLTSGARSSSYERGKIAMSNKIDRLKILYQQQYHEMDILTTRINNMRVRSDVRRALAQEFPAEMTLTEQMEEFRRRFVNNRFGRGQVQCDLETFMKKYKKDHPRASRATMEKKYKLACGLYA